MCMYKYMYVCIYIYIYTHALYVLLSLVVSHPRHPGPLLEVRTTIWTCARPRLSFKRARKGDMI